MEDEPEEPDEEGNTEEYYRRRLPPYISDDPDRNNVIIPIHHADFWLHADDSTFPTRNAYCLINLFM